jgi:hypothetical protein
LIDNFINNDNGKIKLKRRAGICARPIDEEDRKDRKRTMKSYFTETLAKNLHQTRPI